MKNVETLKAELKNLKMFVIQDREAGNVIDEFLTLEDAQKALAAYKEEDKKYSNYVEDFYEIVIK